MFILQKSCRYGCHSIHTLVLKATILIKHDGRIELSGLLLENLYLYIKNVLTELNSYISQNPPPTDAPSVRCTLKYLTGCNLLFERGLLSHDRVHAKDTRVVENVTKGYSFFSDWLNSLLLNGWLLKYLVHIQHACTCMCSNVHGCTHTFLAILLPFNSYSFFYVQILT